MDNKRTPYLVAAGLALVLLALFIYPKLKTPVNSYSGSLECLSPNLPEVQHFHPKLIILVDGEEETMSANVGLSGNCHLPLHTHDVDNIVHVESQVIKDYTLGQFLEVYGKPIQREGYILKMTVDGNPSNELENLVFKDKQEIALDYKSK